MPLVLALEPDLRQAAILKRVIKQEVRAELVLVDSRDAALAALASRVPDVVLLTALLSPRDEEELINHLRSLEGAEHLQTHTIPQLASSLINEDGRLSGGGGLFGRFRRNRKKEAEPMPGCDPQLFAEEVRAFLDRAEELKSESAPPLVLRAETGVEAPAPLVPEAVVPDTAPRDQEGPAAPTSWDSPFEWRGTGPLRALTPTEEPPAVQEVAPTILPEEPVLEAVEPEPLPTTEPLQAEEPPLLLQTQQEQEPEPGTFVAPISFEESSAAEAEEVAETISYVKEAFAEADPEPRPTPQPPQMEVQEASPPAAPEPQPLEAQDEPRDQFAAFRAEADDEGSGVLRFLPLALWARREVPSAPPLQPAPGGEVRKLLAGLSLSPHVTGVAFPRGCRIRRVRVPAAPHTRAAHPVILSRRTLEEMRAADNR